MTVGAVFQLCDFSYTAPRTRLRGSGFGSPLRRLRRPFARKRPRRFAPALIF